MKDFFRAITQNKIWFIVMTILLLILTSSTFYLIYNITLLPNIENLLRLIGGIIIFTIMILMFTLSIIGLKNYRKVLLIILTIFMTLYSTVLVVVDVNFQMIYDKINNVTANYTTLSTNLVTLTTNSVNDVSGIGNDEIGIISNEGSADDYTISKEAIGELKLKNNIKEYNDFIELLEALYDGDIKYIFLPNSYAIRFSNIETFENIQSETKIIYTKEKKTKNTDIAKTKSITEPFTILLMGVDSEAEDISSGAFNGDSLMLVTFNPDTLNATILSIPRDTYVPITCLSGKRKNKINSAAWYGEKCMIDTIENFTGIKIDYYAKINFKGVVKLVDAVGGVDVDVPYNFCEQNSNRQWGANTVFVKKGWQTLNGEQALAFSRNRHPNPQYCSREWTNYDSNDFVRGQNQQIVVTALLNKLKDVRDIDTLYKILDTISINMETNMNINQILSFYNVGKDILAKSKDASNINEIFGMQKLYISGYDAYIYDYSTINNQGTKLELYQFIPYQGSINDVVEAMKVNLGLSEQKVVKTFSFDINNPYEEKVIGKGYYNESSINLLPNFVGSDISSLVNYAEKHGITLNKVYVTSDIPTDFVGMVTSQSVHAKMDLNNLNKQTGITVNVVEKVNTTTAFDYTLCALEENKSNSKCLLDDFVGLDVTSISAWEKRYKLSILVNKVKIDTTDPDYDGNRAGKIISQDVKAGTSLYDLIGKTIKFEYMAEKSSTDPLDPILPDGDGADVTN